MKWSSNVINLGILKENSNIKFSFKSEKELDILKIQAGCSSCTKVGGYKNNELTVTYSTGLIPHHLRHLGSYQIKKDIIITYKNGDQEVLTFKATVKK